MTDEFDDLQDIITGKGHVTGGRYRLPRRDGSKKSYGWMRITNLAGAVADQKQLQDWDKRIMLLGARWRPDIVDELIARADLETLEPTEIRKVLEDFAERLKDAGHGNVGAARGNLRHAAVEAEHAGLPFGVRPRVRLQVENYLAALTKHGLTPVPGLQERVVLVEEFEVAGTLDNVVWDGVWGVHRIADLKTQKRFYTWLNIVIQLWLYASSPVVWDEVSLSWVDMPVKIDPTTGLIAWMPYEHPEQDGQVDIYEVDIFRGRDLARLAHEVVKARSAAKSKRRPWGSVRPTTPTAGTLTERYAQRMRDADSAEEVRSLYQSARIAGAVTRPLMDLGKTRVAELVAN